MKNFTIKCLSSRTVNSVAVVTLLLLSSIMMVSCQTENEKGVRIPQVNTQESESTREPDVHDMYHKLLPLKSSSVAYIEVKRKLVTLSNKKSLTKAEEDKAAELGAFLEKNYTTQIVSRDDIRAYVEALSSKAKEIENDNLKNSFISELDKITPGIPNDILSASQKLTTMTDTSPSLERLKEHVHLLNDLLKFKDEARGI